MKKTKGLILGLAGLLATIIFTACPVPQGIITITLDPSDTTMAVEPGQQITWNVTLTPDALNGGALGLFTVTIDGQQLMSKDFQGATDVQTIQVNYTVPEDAQDGQQILVVFSATDAKSGNTSEVTVKLIVNAVYFVENTETITFTYKSTTLDNEMMLVLTKTGISLAGGTSTEGQIAYIYVYDDNGLVRNTLASPNADEIRQAYSYNNIDYTTSDKQLTYFAKLEGASWDAIDAAYIDQNVNLSSDNSSVIAGNPDLGYGVGGLQVGDIVAFYNPATNIKGVILVKRYDYEKDGVKITSTMDVDIKYLVYPSTTAK